MESEKQRFNNRSVLGDKTIGLLFVGHHNVRGNIISERKSKRREQLYQGLSRNYDKKPLHYSHEGIFMISHW